MKSADNLFDKHRSGADSLFGDVGKDKIHGKSGNDVLFGGSGSDTLNGGKGRDFLYGGTGQDFLFLGKDGATDVCVFENIGDSRRMKTRDVIDQFDCGEDFNSFNLLDADTDKNGVQSFKFAGYKPTEHSIWLVDLGSSILIKGDIDGNRKADFRIEVLDVDTLAASDFLL